MSENRLVFASACLGMLLFGISLITLGSVATGLQAKFHLDAISSGSLFSILPIGMLTGSLLFGPVADRYGYKIILIVSCLLMLIGFQGIAFASIGLLKLCILAFGFGGGVINGACNAVVADISKTHKGANLSLLGIFFAIGALGMPSILGILQDRLSFGAVVSVVGGLPLLATLLFAVTRFPEPKQKERLLFVQIKSLLLDPVLILIAFFLFCQTGFEAIINNWTTRYLSDVVSIPQSNTLFVLSLYVGGMACMRLILGGFLRNLSTARILLIAFVLLASGCAVLKFSNSLALAAVGLILTGAGLAAGFPLMLGLVGGRYTELSGTAFSIVLTIALIGNTAINFAMGFVVESFGIAHLTTAAFVLMVVMALLSVILLKQMKHNS